MFDVIIQALVDYSEDIWDFASDCVTDVWEDVSSAVGDHFASDCVTDVWEDVSSAVGDHLGCLRPHHYLSIGAIAVLYGIQSNSPYIVGARTWEWLKRHDLTDELKDFLKENGAPNTILRFVESSRKTLSMIKKITLFLFYEDKDGNERSKEVEITTNGEEDAPPLTGKLPQEIALAH